MTKRHIEPILWLLFSAGGVAAAVFLPILVVLFGLAIPLGGSGLTTTTCMPWSATGSPGWSC